MTPNRTSVLSGARLAHFERFLHEAPPRWRLRGEKIFVYEAIFETESQEKSNQNIPAIPGWAFCVGG